jgi:hypothetical protein
MTNSSEVARLLAQIEAEQKAAQWALTGLSSGSLRHRFITRCMDRIGVCNEQLVTVIGDRDQAMGLVIKQLEAKQAGVRGSTAEEAIPNK